MVLDFKKKHMRKSKLVKDQVVEELAFLKQLPNKHGIQEPIQSCPCLSSLFS